MSRGARGASHMLLAQVARVGIQFLSVVVLARLLAPEAFGVVAMVTVFISFGEMLRDLGLTTIGLQRPDLTHQQASNLFWINSGLGLVTAIALAASGGLLAMMYQDARMLLLAPALAPVLLINGVTAQLRVQLARSRRFIPIAASDLASPAMNLAVAVALSLLGFDYWAIVMGALAGPLSAFVVIAASARWVPTRPRSDGSSRTLVKDGAAFGMAHFLTFVSQNLDTVIVGVRWDAGSVGIYSRAYQLLQVPVSSLVGPLSQVVVPTVNAAAAEGRPVDVVLQRIQFALGLAITSLFVVTGATADWLIPAMLGPDWVAVVPLFQIIAIGGVFWGFSNVNYWRTIIGNNGMQLAYYNLVSKGLGIALIVVGSFISIEAVASAVALSLFINWAGGLVWFWKAAHWPSAQYFREALRILVPGLVVYAVSWGLMQYVGGAERWWAAIAVGLFAGAALIGSILLQREGRERLRGALAIIRRMARRAQGPAT